MTTTNLAQSSSLLSTSSSNMAYYDQNGELVLLSPRIKQPIETLRVSLVHNNHPTTQSTAANQTTIMHLNGRNNTGGSDSGNHSLLPTSASSHSSSSTSSSSYNNDPSPKQQQQQQQQLAVNNDEDYSSYEKLADYWLDYSARARMSEKSRLEALAKHSMCVINYPDILENSLVVSSSARNNETSCKPTQSNEAMCCLNEFDDDNLSQDVISLNVDFSNEDEPKNYERYHRTDKVNYN